MKQSTLLSMINNAAGQRNVTDGGVKNKEDGGIKNKEKTKPKSPDRAGENVNPDHEKSSVVQQRQGVENKSSISIDLKGNESSDSAAKVCKSQTNEGNSKSVQVLSYDDFISENLSGKSGSAQNGFCEKQEYETKEQVKMDNSTSEHDDNRIKKQDETESHSQTQTDKDIDSKENDDSKKSMSYLDFLGMFEPQPNSKKGNDSQELPGLNSVVDHEDQDEITKTKDDHSNKSSVKKENSGCKSIASYFKSSSKPNSTPCGKSRPVSSTDIITITAEVHSQPLSADEDSPKRERTKNKRPVTIPQPCNSESDHAMSDEIILLSSETINVDDKTQEKGTRKRKLVNDNEKDMPSDHHSKKKKSSLSLSKDDNNSVDRKPSKSANSLKTSSSPNSTHSHSSQSKLSFGASGLTVTKEQPEPMLTEEVEKVDIDLETSDTVVTHDCSEMKETKDLEHSTTNTAESKNKKQFPKNEHETVEVKDVSTSEADKAILPSPDNVEDKGETCTDNRKEGKLKLRSRKSVVTETDPLPSITQEPEKNDDQPEKMETDEEQGTPSLRRSSRLRQSVQSAKKVEVIEVDVDEDEHKQTNSHKGKDKQKKSSKNSQQSSEKSEGCQSPKVVRKLAPIFTRLKPAQLETKPPSPTPEELEKLRSRQEFLMSGIPDELKRAKAAMALQAVSEYPPFPNPSHVQQVDSEQLNILCSANENKIKMLTNTQDRMDVGSLEWKALKCLKNITEADTPRKLFFQDFSGHPQLGLAQMDVLIRDLEERDKTFPFREALDLFAKDLKSNEDVSKPPEQNVVVVDGLTPPPKRRASSRSKGNSKVVSSPGGVDDVIVVDDLSPTPSGATTTTLKFNSNKNGLLWTDEHPMTSKFIIGNGKVVKQLRDWLEEWHAEMQKDAKKALKGAKSSKKKVQEWSDDSDFTNSSDDSCMRLCNAMLITGPHGVGKTSIVYCLAQELGFKVFEVNPTSLRSGKQLQSQLEEATQSHRVVQSSNPGSSFATPPAGTPKDKNPQTTTKHAEKKPVCKAFSGFFKKANSTKPEETKKESKRKREETQSPKSESKRGGKKKVSSIKTKEQDNASSDISNPLNITSASIILFDEADVVLEDDKGFLATVQHFMSSTKIPIVITSTNPYIHQELSPRHEHIVLKRPSSKAVSCFLHSVCLAKGLRVSFQSLHHLASVLKQDVRRCLLYVQYWCQSGGGRKQTESDPWKQHPVEQETVKGHQTHTSIGVDTADLPSSDNSNDSEFLSLRPTRKRMMVIADEDSNSNSCHVIKDESSKSEANKSLLSSCRDSDRTDDEKGVDKSSQILPSVHLGCDVSLIGGNNDCDSFSAFITDLIKRPTVHDLTDAVNRINHIESYLPCRAVYNLANRCCSLPKMRIPSVRLEIHEPKSKTPKKKRKRIMMGDWFDSDGSDEDQSKNSQDDIGDKNERLSPASLVETEKDNDQTQILQNEKSKEISNRRKSEEKLVQENVVQQSNGKVKRNALTAQLLNSFCRFYEDNSSLQYLCSKSDKSIGKQCVLPGTSDEEVLLSESDFSTSCDLFGEICCSGELLSARTLVKNVDELWSNRLMTEKKDCKDGDIPFSSQLEEDEFKEMNSLPIGESQTPNVWSFERSFSDVSKESSIKYVTSRLGTWIQSSGSKSSLHLDYLPVLREICRSEQERQASQMKRRFNHYLDYNGLNLKESTITSLSTTYSVV